MTRRMCDSCETTQGPFYKVPGTKKRACKNLKNQVHKDNNCQCRVSLCVKRREKLDYDRYEGSLIASHSILR